MKQLIVSVLAASLGFWAAPLMADDAPGGERHYEAVSFNDLPPAVQAALVEESGSGVVVEIRKEEQDGQVTYEAEVVNRGKGRDVEFSSDGKLLKRVPEYYENY
jgi:hypothetical protein